MIYGLSTKRRKMKTREYLDTAAKIVTGQRQHDYGDKYQNHENISKLWSAYLGYTISAHDVAICMLLLKVARLKHRPTTDCYIDMAGYAAIAGEINDRKEDGATNTSISLRVSGHHQRKFLISPKQKK